MSFKLSDLKENNSDLLELLTQHIPDMLWAKDTNGNYLYANKTICEGLLMAKDTQEPIGKNDVFFALREREAHKDKPDWHTFGELCFNSDIDVIEQNKAMRFEEYGNVKGEMLYLEVYKAPFYDEEGNIIGTVGSGRDITKLKKIQKDLESSLKSVDQHKELLEYQANHDSLTDLPNRTLFMDRLNQAVHTAKRNNNKVAILFIDLDDFKEINDSLGHEIGDKVLIKFAKRMNKNMRESDTLARLGGDEFCVILNNISENKSVLNFINKCMKSIKKPFLIGNSTFYIGMSIGVALYPMDGTSAELLLQNSDAAMYKAKEINKSSYSFYNSDMTQKAQDRIFIEAELRKAFKQDELKVYYQPQVDSKTDKLVGMEALVRWEHPTMGFINPDKFIPFAEETGMIVELDRIVMKKSMKQFKKWKLDGFHTGKLSLNLAMKQLEEKDFVEYLQKLVKENKLEYEMIEFEVTETSIMKNPEHSIEILKKISDLNISISVDDFGTGYSSLSYLKKLPIHKLKIDKTFVDELPNDDEDIAISKTIISLCKNLNLDVIAEGVESIEQKDFLLQNGCNSIQGYYYSKALSAEDMTEYLKNNNIGQIIE